MEYVEGESLSRWIEDRRLSQSLVSRDDAAMVDRERMNLWLDEVPPMDLDAPIPPAPYGLDFDDEARVEALARSLDVSFLSRRWQPEPG